MNKICIKCRYIRGDYDTAPEGQCPGCGELYEKTQADYIRAVQNRKTDGNPNLDKLRKKASLLMEYKFSVIVWLVIFGIIISVFVDMQQTEKPTPTIQENKVDSEYVSCVNRGIQYFYDIGSFPTLKSPPNQGRQAKDVAEERCSRGSTAF